MAGIAGINEERKEFKIVEMPNVPGRLSYTLATGKAKFGTDVIVPDMLFAEFLYSMSYRNSMETFTCTVTVQGDGKKRGVWQLRYQPCHGDLKQLIVCAVANAIGKWLPPPLTHDKILNPHFSRGFVARRHRRAWIQGARPRAPQR